MEIFKRIGDFWDHAHYYNWLNFNRMTWRTVQLAISLEALTLALANLVGTSDIRLVTATLGLLIMIPVLEKERVERRGTGPTGRQYLSTLFLGRRLMGYDAEFWEWKKTVDQATHAYFPPYESRVEKSRCGVCTWSEYVRYIADINELGLGNDPQSTWKSIHKASTM